MNILWKALLMVGLVALAGCGKDRIDASTRASMLETTEALRSGLDEARRQEVDQALIAILIDALDPVEVVQYGNRTDLMVEREIFLRIKPRFDGLDEHGLMEAATAARESLSGKMARWEAERAGLLDKRARFEQAGDLLSLVTVTEAHLEIVESVVTAILPSEQVQVRVVIHNASDEPVEGVELRLGVGPESSNEAWAGGEFSHSFAPALAPGSAHSATFGPMLLEIPATQQAQAAGAQLTAMIEVTAVSRADGQAVLKSEWTQGDALREAVLDAAQDVVRELELTR